MKRSLWIIILATIALIAMTFGIPGVATAAPLKGAIFTTTDDGSIVNENVHYEAKIDVYLDGGPGPNAPQGAAGLPDGDYVFQVTDPSGKVLLSQDAAKWRVVRVADGVIVSLRDWLGGTSFADHPLFTSDAGHKEGKVLGMHDTNYDVDHPPAIVVQLMPFLDTPNPGGVYKAWMTPVSTYLSKGGNLNANPAVNNNQIKVRGQVIGYKPDPGFGPPRDQVKTDNFKVKEFHPPEIKVRKFHDKNADGIWQRDAEPEIGVDQFVDQDGVIKPYPDGGGWPFDVRNPSGTDINNPYYTPKIIVAGEVGTYFIKEHWLPHWKQTAAYVDGVRQPLIGDPLQEVSVQVSGCSFETHEVIFGNVHLGKVKVCKFHDANHDGDQDDGEGPLAGWQFKLYQADGNTPVTTDAYGNSVENPKTTGSDTNCVGCITWEDLLPGTYVVREIPQDHWKCTTGQSQTIEVRACTTTRVKFGNVHLGRIKVCKFHDADHDGDQDDGEGPLSGWEFTLYQADGVTPVTTDGYGNKIENPKTTGECGCVAWDDLMPGDYVCKETPQDHWKCTTGASMCISFQSCTSETVVKCGNVHLGRIKVCKFYDANRNGTHELNGTEGPLSGWQFTLYEADGVTPVTEDAHGHKIDNPKTTGECGCVAWDDLMPGAYVVKEMPQSGWICTTNPDLTQRVEFTSCTAETVVTFGNFRANGLTPGFWKNWRNHFSDAEFTDLLDGTIAANISQADAIFDHWDASPDDELTILKAMLLANQLTLNLSASDPGNQYGWLAPYVSIEGMGTLQQAINDALAILANPSGYSRDYILGIKNKLDAFANL